MGLFRSHDSTRGALPRAVLGTVLLTGGVVAGVWIGVPRLHRAMTATHDPVSLSCVELLRGGVPENSSIVKLRNAQVHPPDPFKFAREGQVLSPMLTQIDRILEDPRAVRVADAVVRADVLPRGIARRPGMRPLRLTSGRTLAQVTIQEIEETGSLTVHVMEDPTAKLIYQAAGLLQVPVPATLKQSAELPSYSLHPVSMIGSHRNAICWVVGGGAAIALGLVLCGSLPLGWWALLCPISAVCGLPGLVLRTGRGGKVVWLIVFVAGVACLAGGFHLAITMGRLGQVAGVWSWQAAGLLAISSGAAAIFGTMLSVRASQDCELYDESLDSLTQFTPKLKSKRRKRCRHRHAGKFHTNPRPQPRPAALQSMISQADYARRYLDPRLNVSASEQTTPEVQEQTECLEQLQFDSPLIIQIARGEDTIHATVQIGCRNLVLAMTDCLDGQLRLRMVSILDDGHVVLSGSGLDNRLTDTIHGEASSLLTFEIPKACRLLAKHLELAAEIAERRRSKLTHLDPSEWRDMLHYSERCMAATLHAAQVEKWEIGAAQYGRFAFPPSPVQSPTFV